MMTLVLGLTGSFGSGKTTVATLFGEWGAAVIDADALAREAVEPGQPALAEIVTQFGPAMLDAQGRLDRPRLAGRVFADRQAAARLGLIVHPFVRVRTRERLEELAGRSLVVLDVPLLFEAGMAALADKTAVVTIAENQRFLRLRRRGFAEREVIQRLGMQMPQARKIRLADYAIDNSGTIEATRKQVQTLMDHLTREKPDNHEFKS